MIEHEQVDNHSTELALRSTEDLESWLASDSFNSKIEVQELGLPTGYATIKLDPVTVEPVKMTLLDFTNGEGLEVKYTYSFEVHESHHHMVWIKLHVMNKSQDVLSAIYVSDLEFEATAPSSKIARDIPAKYVKY